MMFLCVDVRLERVFAVCAAKDREMLDFDVFNNRRLDVEHAYIRLVGIEGKPDFETIYSYMSKLIEPFARKDRSNILWDSSTMAWLDDEITEPQLEVKVL